MNNQSYLTAFTTQVLNLATELKDMYPDENDFKTSHTAVILMKKTNPRLLHNIIMEKLTFYRDQIFAEDDKFFANRIAELEEAKDESANPSETKQSYIENKAEDDKFNLIIRVRTYWNEMSEKTKKNIWMYLKVLFRLSDRLN